MKKLLYQYIENVGKIKEQEIYYSHDYKFSYDKVSKELFAEKIEGKKVLYGLYGEHKNTITKLYNVEVYFMDALMKKTLY